MAIQDRRTHSLPVGLALCQEYTRRNPDGLKVPPVDGHNVEDPELLPYIKHVASATSAMKFEIPLR
jgi:hypothetical protein